MPSSFLKHKEKNKEQSEKEKKLQKLERQQKIKPNEYGLVSKKNSTDTSQIKERTALKHQEHYDNQNPSTSGLINENINTEKNSALNLSLFTDLLSAKRKPAPKTIITGSVTGCGRKTPTVTRTPSSNQKKKTFFNKLSTTNDDDEEEEEEISLEQKFYYLKLMAKPGQRPEPIKMKFVRWASPTERKLSVDDEGVLESQAMRVVRTIGQAFEVCYKISQDQMQEKQQLDEIDASTADGTILEEITKEDTKKEASSIQLDDGNISNQLGIDSRSPSSSPIQPPPISAMQPRQSIYVTCKESSEISLSQGEISGNAVFGLQQQPIIESIASAATIIPTCLTQQTVNTLHTPLYSGTLLSQVQPIQSQFGIASSSNTLPHSLTWNPSTSLASGALNPQLIPPFQSIQALNPTGQQPSGYSFYSQIPSMITASASVPYGLSSPMVVSPYATLQLPNPAPIRINATDDNGSNETMQLTRTLDQYNLIRSQLDYVQQSAQVANCQVQFLRDQLSNETTARLEAQSRTSQLLNFQRDLLDQMNHLVTRLQKLETVYANAPEKFNQKTISERITPNLVPSTILNNQSNLDKQTTAQTLTSQTVLNSSIATMPQFSELLTSTTVQSTTALTSGLIYNKPMLQQPYQVQTLADLRSGSLPLEDSNNLLPSVALKKNGKRRLLANGDDSGVRTEPDSVTEDTTDYSSSDHYEKAGVIGQKINQETNTGINYVPTTSLLKNINPILSQQAIPHYNILLSNPLSNLQVVGQNNLASQITLIPPITNSKTIDQKQTTQPLNSSIYQSIQNHTQQWPQNWQNQTMRSDFSASNRLLNQQQQSNIPMISTSSNATTSSHKQSSPIRQSSPKRQLRRFSLQALQRLLPDDFANNDNDSNQPTFPGKKSKHGSSGVFKEKDVGFSRMSFNTRLNNPSHKKQANTMSDHLIEVPEESKFEYDNEKRRFSDTRRRSLGGLTSLNHGSRSSISASPAHLSVAANEFATTNTNQKRFGERSNNNNNNYNNLISIASTSVATAMYPQIKKNFDLIKSDLSKKGFHPLTIEMNDSNSVSNLNFPSQTLLNASELTKNSGNNASVHRRTSRSNTTVSVTQPNIDQQEHRHSIDSDSSSKGSALNVLTTNLTLESKKNYLDSLIDLPTNSNQTTDTLIQKNFQFPADSDSVKGRTLQALDAKKLADPILLERLATFNQNNKRSKRHDSEGTVALQSNGIL